MNVLTWRMFSASSMKAAIHLGPNFKSNSEIYKNTKNSRILRMCSTLLENCFKNSLNKFWMWNAWNVHHRHGRSRQWPMIKQSNGRKRSMCVRWLRSLCRTSKRYARSSTKMERPRWRSQDVFVLPRCCGNPRWSCWIRVVKMFPGFSSSSVLREIQQDLEEKNIQPEDFKDQIISCQSSMTLSWKRMMKMYFECRRSQELRHEIHARRFLGPGSEEKWYGKSSQTVQSVNQLSVYGTVTNWCYQLGLTEEEKGRVGIPVDKKILTMVESEEVQLLVYLRLKHVETRCKVAPWASKHWIRRYGSHNSNILWSPGKRTKFDRMRTTDGEQLLLCAANIRVLDLIRKPRPWQLFPKAHLEVHVVENLDG